MIPGLDTLLGGAVGAAFRFAPEILKYLDRNRDRAHELALFDKQLAADAQKSREQLAVISAQHAAEADTKDLEALIAAVTVQGGKSGVNWVDGLNALVRPILTLYWCIILYTGVLIARWSMLQGQGVAADAAILQLWGSGEAALVSSMLSFWFVDRALRRGGGASAPH